MTLETWSSSMSPEEWATACRATVAAARVPTPPPVEVTAGAHTPAPSPAPTPVQPLPGARWPATGPGGSDGARRPRPWGSKLNPGPARPGSGLLEPDARPGAQPDRRRWRRRLLTGLPQWHRQGGRCGEHPEAKDTG